MSDNINETDPQVIFGDLFSRLYQIRNGLFDYLGGYNYRSWLTLIIQNIFKLNNNISSTYLTEALYKVDEIQKNLEEIINALEVKEEIDHSRESFFGISLSKEKVKERVRDQLVQDMFS